MAGSWAAARFSRATLALTSFAGLSAGAPFLPAKTPEAEIPSIDELLEEHSVASFPSEDILGLRHTTITQTRRHDVTTTTTQYIREDAAMGFGIRFGLPKLGLRLPSLPRMPRLSWGPGDGQPAVPRTFVEWGSGGECDVASDSNVQGIPEQCLRDVSEYSTDSGVQALCSNLPHWQNIASKSLGDCKMDPATGKAICSKAENCSRSVVKTAVLKEGQKRRLSYNCGFGCKGALLVDCCSTCFSIEKNPKAYGVDNITCLGCSSKELETASETAYCKLNQRVFRCESRGMCAAGLEEVSCKKTNLACHITPCDSCGDAAATAQCCSACLAEVCGGSPRDRLHCQGCDSLPGGKWWDLR